MSREEWPSITISPGRRAESPRRASNPIYAPLPVDTDPDTRSTALWRNSDDIIFEFDDVIFDSDDVIFDSCDVTILQLSFSHNAAEIRTDEWPSFTYHCGVENDRIMRTPFLIFRKFVINLTMSTGLLII